MLRRVALACLVCGAVSAGISPVAIADDTAPAAPSSPLSSRIIKAGIQQDEDAQSTLAAGQNWELQARTVAAEQEEAQIGSFMNNPLVSRVTSVGEIDKTSGLQKITALPIHSVTVSDDGSVDIGQLVDGSGAELWIPPGSLAKADLFTKVGTQYVKVSANHFDPMGSLADQQNKQLPPDSPTALNQLANQLANAVDAYANNAATFASDFLTGATSSIGNALNFLAQQRGDFGQPGKPLQDLWNYLNNDYNQNDQALRAAAEQAVANHPGAALGSNLLAFAPLGQLGQEAEIAQISQAAQRLTALENTAADFTNMERGLPSYPSVTANAALKHAGYPPGGPGVPEPYLPGARTTPLAPSEAPSGNGIAPAGGVDNTVPSGAAGTNGTPGSLNDGTPPFPPGGAAYPTVPGKAALQHARFPADGPGVPEPYLPGAKTTPLNSSGTPWANGSVPSGGVDHTVPAGGTAPGATPPGPLSPNPADAPTVQTPPLPSGAVPMGSNPNSPLQSRIIPTQQSDAPSPAGTSANGSKEASNQAAQAQDQAARDAASRQRAAQNVTAAEQAAELRRATANSSQKPAKTGPVTPEQRQRIQESVNALHTALSQDAQWASGATPVSPPSAASPPASPSSPAMPTNPATPTREPDIISTLESRFGNNPKDPLQGAPGLLESRFGIPTQATSASISNALTIAGNHSQGLIFSPGTAGSVNILNARNNDGQIEFQDPSSGKPADPPANSPLYFYRTQ
jgi:hypothetical protein